MLRWYTYQARFIDIEFVLLKFYIFIPAESHFMLLLGGFLARPQGPQPNFGIVRAQNVLNDLQNDTKANFQENILGKVRFQEKGGGGEGGGIGPPLLRRVNSPKCC